MVKMESLPLSICINVIYRVLLEYV